MTTKDTYTLCEGNMISVLALALRTKDKEVYMEAVSEEIVSQLVDVMNDIHENIVKYSHNKQCINECDIDIHDDIDYDNSDHEYTKDIAFINEHRNDAKGVAKLKALLITILTKIAIASDVGVVYDIRYKHSSNAFKNKCIKLKDINTYINNIKNACAFSGSFTNADLIACTKCLRSVLDMYRILHEVISEIENPAINFNADED